MDCIVHGITKSWTRLGDFCLFCYETLYLSQFSPSVVSDSLQPHGLLHARPPYPSWTSRVYSNLWALSWWCYPTISSSVVPFSTCFILSPHQGLFECSALPIRWPKYWSFSFIINPSYKHSGLTSSSMNWLELLAVQWTLNSLLQHHSLKALPRATD